MNLAEAKTTCRERLAAASGASRLPLAVLAAALLLTGCMDAGGSRLVGTWQMETADQIQRRLDRADPQQSQLADVIKSTSKLFRRVGGESAMGSISMAFRADGMMESVTDFPMARSQKTYRWKLVSFDRAKQRASLRFELIDPRADVKEITETEIVFLDDDTIRLVPPNLDAIELELVFRRQRQ